MQFRKGASREMSWMNACMRDCGDEIDICNLASGNIRNSRRYWAAGLVCTHVCFLPKLTQASHRTHARIRVDGTCIPLTHTTPYRCTK